MYGIVNQAINGLVVENYGEESWEKIKVESGIEQKNFLSNESYDDSITYSLAGAAAKVLGVTVGDVLIALGEYWILKTGKEKYGALMESGGHDLMEFLINLPNFHSRVMLMYPNLTPPEFKTEEVGERKVKVEYFSEREGLTDFMRGLLYGLMKMYDIEGQVELTSPKQENKEHDEFMVTW